MTTGKALLIIFFTLLAIPVIAEFAAHLFLHANIPA
jgi:hypothetical protein